MGRVSVGYALLGSAAPLPKDRPGHMKRAGRTCSRVYEGQPPCRNPGAHGSPKCPAGMPSLDLDAPSFADLVDHTLLKPEVTRAQIEGAVKPSS